MKPDIAMAVGAFVTLGIAGLIGYIPHETVGVLCIAIGMLSGALYHFSEWYETDSDAKGLTEWEGSEE